MAMNKDKSNQNQWKHVTKESFKNNQVGMIQLARLEALQKSWRLLPESNGMDLSNDKHLELVKNKYDSPILFLKSILETGKYPNPEIMMWLLICFESYFDAAGTLSIQDILFGKPTQKTGDFAASKHADRRYQFFHWAFEDALEKAKVNKTNPPSRAAVIRDFLSNEFWAKETRCINSASFEKGYMRWLKKNADN